MTELLSTDEASKYLRRSPAAIRNLVLRRQIPFRKPGGRLLFVKEELRRWVEMSPGISIDELKHEKAFRAGKAKSQKMR